MQRNIMVFVKDKVAYAPKDAAIVCNNRDYTISFVFDDEWNEIDKKTARFVSNGKHTDVVFTGNSVKAPPICNAAYVKVGVFAPEIATTYATIRCGKSILCEGGTVPDPPLDVYAQIIDMLNQIEEGRVPDEEIEAAVNEYLEANPVEIATDESINFEDGVLSVNMERIIEQLPVFEGEYCVTPSTEEQTLMTEKKYLDANVKVETIPYSAVSNTVGGTTVSIG